jgi:HD-GYP domain-containing protein (c-di-GMP phosphodiesterase class II)
VAVQPDAATIPDPIRDRVAALGLTMLTLAVDGQAQLVGAARPIDRLIALSPLFRQLSARRWSELREAQGKALSLWPGVWLAPLPGRRRRRNDEQPLAVALMLSHAVLDSEQLHQVCDAHQVDRRAVIAGINPDTLLAEPEVQRLAVVLGWMQQDSVELTRQTFDLQTMTRQLGESYEELSLLYKMSSNMAVNQSPLQFLREVAGDLQQTIGLRWLTIQLSADERRLESLAGQIFTAGEVGCDDAQLRAVGEQIMRIQHDLSAGQVWDDTSQAPVESLRPLARQVIVVPLLHAGAPLGLIFGGDKSDGSHLTSVDSKLCKALANTLTIFLENMMLYEDMQAMFLGTLHALTNSIDAKDSYTHGHSERVALMSRKLAEAAGVAPEIVERVYISGLVHDVGKIGVPESVLCKPGQLTDEEFALIRQHPEIGARILQDIRQMQDLIPGVLYHHERWDGRGYPHGLAGEKIPLFGRIIGLADSFDAMSSNRTYRHALNHDQVISEIKRCAGQQFDPVLAQLFVELDFADFYRLIRRHQQNARRDGMEGAA